MRPLRQPRLLPAGSSASSISKPKQYAPEDAIRQEIISTVQNVLGRDVGENVPLIQAGLDSLGEALLPISWSPTGILLKEPFLCKM